MVEDKSVYKQIQCKLQWRRCHLGMSYIFHCYLIFWYSNTNDSSNFASKSLSMGLQCYEIKSTAALFQKNPDLKTFTWVTWWPNILISLCYQFVSLETFYLLMIDYLTIGVEGLFPSFFMVSQMTILFEYIIRTLWRFLPPVARICDVRKWRKSLVFFNPWWTLILTFTS